MTREVTDAVPTSLGPFAISAVLGKGGSGTVYAAKDEDGAELALKVLNIELALSDKECRRFLQEAESMERVSHAGLISLVASGILPDGRPYLAMPHLRGETLGALLERGPLSVQSASLYFSVLVKAVATLHRSGLIHRDIKPENVFVLEGDRAVLLDFGIARDVLAPDGTTTQTGGVRGTPAYMAPERFFGMGATVSSDLYELGVLFYMMLTARLPWSDEQGPAGRLHPKFPAEAGVELPPGLVAVLMRALSTRPETRPVSADAFAEQVENALRADVADGPRTTAEMTAVSVPPLQEMTRPSSSRRWPLAMIAVVLGTSAFGATWFALRRSPPEPIVAAAPPVAQPAPLLASVDPSPVLAAAAVVASPAASSAARDLRAPLSKPAVVPSVSPSASAPASSGKVVPRERYYEDRK